MLEILFSRPHHRGMYAMLTRARVGQFLLCSKIGPNYEFIQLPDLYTLSFTPKEFKKAVESDILEYVETLPEEVFNSCVANAHNKDPLEFPDNYSEFPLDSTEERDYLKEDEKIN